MQKPTSLLFIQHGLTDTVEPFLRLLRQLPIGQGIVRVPQLDRIQTLLSMEPLITTVELHAAELITEHTDVPIDSIGHSMGVVTLA